MMNKHIRLLLTTALVIITGSSCEDILDTTPTESIDSEVALSSFSGLKAILVDGYDDLQSTSRFGSQLYVQPEIMGDNVDFLNRRGTYSAHYRNLFRTHLNGWQNYNPINDMTLLIEAIQKFQEDPTGFDPTEINSVEGQARALRAFYYFVTVNIHAYTPTAIIDSKNRGGVPILEKGVVAFTDIDFDAVRNPIDEVYTFIKDDLTAAIGMLDNTDTNDQTFIGRAAAQAILSRVALYNGDWADAVSAATDVIDDPTSGASLSTYATYASDWSEALHPESLFTLFYETAENPGSNIAISSIYSPEGGGFGDYVPTEVFKALLSTNDARRQLLLDTDTDGLEEYRKMTSDAGEQFLDHIPMIRLSEVYLNRAEAYARQGLRTQAIADLDLIRARTLGPDFVATSVTTDEELIDAILLERRLELAFEGHRWFDLKRIGEGVDKSDTTGEVIAHSDDRMLAPIPANDIAINNNIVQNDGY